MAINLAGFLGQASGLNLPNAFGGGSNTPFDLLNPSTSRLSIAGLIPGGASSAPQAIPNIGFQSASGQGGATAASEDDWRVRVSLSPNCPIFYNDPTIASQGANNSLLYPLKATNGVIWPYTPSITVQHNAMYTSAALTHSNYPAHFYNSSEVADITVSGEFTVQSEADGQYLMAAVYFFRAASKMFFGQGANVGNPPPIVFLDGYGSHYLPHVPCVIMSFQHTLTNDVDYIQVPITSSTLVETQVAPNTAVNPAVNNGVNNSLGAIVAPNFNQTNIGAAQDAKLAQNNATAAQTKFGYSTITTHTRVPTASTISVTLRPVYSRSNLHKNFDLNKFASGGLLQAKDGSYGGFI